MAGKQQAMRTLYEIPAREYPEISGTHPVSSAPATCPKPSAAQSDLPPVW